MKKRIIVCMLLLFVGSNLYAQKVYNSSGKRIGATKKKKDAGFDPQKLIFGGGLGLGFGDVTTINVAPVVGYRFTEKLSAGVGLGYQYLKIKNALVIPDINGFVNYFDYKASIVYPSIWGRFRFLENFFVHGELEQDFQRYTDYRFSQSGSGAIESFKVKYNNTALLLGGGIRQPVTDRSSLVLMALYDVIQDKYSPYLNTIYFRFGFNVGF